MDKIKAVMLFQILPFM